MLEPWRNGEMSGDGGGKSSNVQKGKHLLSNTDWFWKLTFYMELKIFLNEFNVKLKGIRAFIYEI